MSDSGYGLQERQGCPWNRRWQRRRCWTDWSDFIKIAIVAIASIDLKKEEKGILSLSQDWTDSFCDLYREELKQVPGEFTPSPFVKKITGVDNVCERSAVLASGNGKTAAEKTQEKMVWTTACGCPGKEETVL